MIEALSVILQVALLQADAASASSAWRRCTTTSSSIGWKEPQIIIRFWIVAFIFALFTLTTLKLR